MWRQERFMAAIAAGESGERVRIPLAVTGTWVRGEAQFSITPKDLESIRSNFSERQNGEVNVDYDHASEMPEVAAGGPIPSAGRIVGIDPAEGQGRRAILWGWYEPTERARALIEQREYRYISPAIDWGARNKRTGKSQGATLTSVALTNRPFLDEMPQIRLADPECRLVDGQQEIQGAMDGAETGGGSMKKVKLSVGDGNVRVSHSDFEGEYFADAGEAAECLRELGAPVTDAADAGLKVAASETNTGLKPGATAGATDARVEQAIEGAVRAGKILPRRREDWRRIALADFDTFARLMAEEPVRIPIQPVGFAGAVSGDVQAQVKFLAEQRMRERNVSYGQALTEIGREQPDLLHEYRRSVSGGRQ